MTGASAVVSSDHLQRFGLLAKWGYEWFLIGEANGSRTRIQAFPSTHKQGMKIQQAPVTVEMVHDSGIVPSLATSSEEVI